MNRLRLDGKPPPKVIYPVYSYSNSRERVATFEDGTEVKQTLIKTDWIDDNT